MIDSERLDKESASSAYRRRRCPGSPNLVRALRSSGAITKRSDPDAESGTRVHHTWCGMEASLSPRERDTLESLQRMEALLVTDWAAEQEFVLLGRETRLWLHEGLEPIHSGAFDVAYGTVGAGPARMLIIDGKTLFGSVTDAAQNDQLRELVALARANFSRCTEFTVAILQPWVSKRPNVAFYDQAEAELALRELRATLRDSSDPDAPRIPGAWCEHCPAFDSCDEPRRLSTHTGSIARQIVEGTFSLPVGKEGARLLEAVKLAQGYLRVLGQRYKELLEQNPDCLPGWCLRPGKHVRVIEDVGAALSIATSFMTQDKFLSALSVNVSALEELCSEPAGGLRGRALSDFFNSRFASVLSIEQRAPELARTRKENINALLPQNGADK